MEVDEDPLSSIKGMSWVDAARHMRLDDDPLGGGKPLPVLPFLAAVPSFRREWPADEPGCPAAAAGDGEREKICNIDRNLAKPGGSSLKKEDMVVHGLCPARDEFFLVVCEHCDMLVKPQVLDYHIDLRHKRRIGESHASAFVPTIDDALSMDRSVTRKRPAEKRCGSPTEAGGQSSSCHEHKSCQAKNQRLKTKSPSVFGKPLPSIGEHEREDSDEEMLTLKSRCAFNNTRDDSVPSTRNNLRMCLPLSFHMRHGILSSRSILPQNSLETSASFAHNDLCDHSEGSVSAPQPLLPSSCFSSSLITPTIRLKVLYSFKKSAQKEEAVVESSTGPDLDHDRMGNTCYNYREGVRAQSPVLIPFCPQLDSDVKDDSSNESKLTLPKEILFGGRRVQDLIVTSSNSNASESNRTDHLSSSESAESLMSSHFAQDSSLSKGRQDFDFSNRVCAFAAADSHETVRLRRAAPHVWTDCSVESSPNSTAFHLSTCSVESSKDQSADLVVTDDVDVNLSVSTVVSRDDSKADVRKSTVLRDRVGFLGELISSESIPPTATLSHAGPHVGPVPQVTSTVSHFSSKFHIATAPSRPLSSVGAPVRKSGQVSYAKSWLCQVGANDR